MILSQFCSFSKSVYSCEMSIEDKVGLMGPQLHVKPGVQDGKFTECCVENSDGKCGSLAKSFFNRKSWWWHSIPRYLCKKRRISHSLHLINGVMGNSKHKKTKAFFTNQFNISEGKTIESTERKVNK